MGIERRTLRAPNGLETGDGVLFVLQLGAFRSSDPHEPPRALLHHGDRCLKQDRAHHSGDERAEVTALYVARKVQVQKPEIRNPQRFEEREAGGVGSEHGQGVGAQKQDDPEVHFSESRKSLFSSDEDPECPTHVERAESDVCEPHGKARCDESRLVREQEGLLDAGEGQVERQQVQQKVAKAIEDHHAYREKDDPGDESKQVAGLELQGLPDDQGEEPPSRRHHAISQ